MRLAVSLLLMTIGGSGMYSVTVVLPRIQAEFGVARADASLPYTADHDRLRPRRHPDGPAGRPLRRAGAGGARRRRPGRRLHRRRAGAQPVAVLRGAGPVDRPARDLGHLRAAGGRHLAVVRPPARHRAGDLHERQLHRRGRVAAGDAALHRQRGLAPDLCRHGRSSAWPPCCRWRWCLRRASADACRGAGGARRPGRNRARPAHGHEPGHGAGAAVRGRRFLLRRDVDAAGAHRRLLRRPRLRRGARRGDAVADAGTGRGQPARLGLDLGPHRRPAHAAARLGAAGRGAAAVPAVRRAWSRCTWWRACSACSRAASCRPMR